MQTVVTIKFVGSFNQLNLYVHVILNVKKVFSKFLMRNMEEYFRSSSFDESNVSRDMPKTFPFNSYSM